MDFKKMSIVSQMYKLQEVDLEIESDERTLNHITSQLGESKIVIEAQNKLDSERQHLEELLRQQQSVEWEIDDISSKLASVEKDLYGGRIRNPKELTDLQHEADLLKANLTKLEDRALGIMEQVEASTKSASSLDKKFNRLEAEWQGQQKKLSADLEQLQSEIANLKQKRQLLAKEIDPQAVEIYQELRKKRGTAVAKVEQGICDGCRISLPVSELQQVRTGSLVRCGSCGRILFLA
ncbi:zinc ribbon domain-containing protein [Chloroflexota bacterium]